MMLRTYGIIVVKKGHYYEAHPSVLRAGIFVVKNMNHKAKTVEIQNVKNGQHCWTKISNIYREITEEELMLELLE